LYIIYPIEKFQKGIQFQQVASISPMMLQRRDVPPLTDNIHVRLHGFVGEPTVPQKHNPQKL
jgi:hypothetical protein